MVPRALTSENENVAVVVDSEIQRLSPGVLGETTNLPRAKVKRKSNRVAPAIVSENSSVVLSSAESPQQGGRKRKTPDIDDEDDVAGRGESPEAEPPLPAKKAKTRKPRAKPQQLTTVQAEAPSTSTPEASTSGR